MAFNSVAYFSMTAYVLSDINPAGSFVAGLIYSYKFFATTENSLGTSL